MRVLIVLGMLSVLPPLQGGLITYNNLAASTTQGGVTLTITNNGGALSFTSSLMVVGGVFGSGVYTFTFSQPITYFQISFATLYDTTALPRHAIFDFQADGNVVPMSFQNGVNALFDGSILTTNQIQVFSDAILAYGTANGQTTPFQTFSFRHTQGNHPDFWVTRIRIFTQDVPEPGSSAMFAGGGGLLMAGAWARRRWKVKRQRQTAESA